jgi:GAF domain-containing protein
MIAESAARLCEGQFCFVYRFDGQLLHFVAHHSLTPEVLEMNRRAYPAPPSRRSAAARAILERGFVQIPDINADPDYVLGAQAVVGGYRSVVGVPILRDGLPIGSIAVARAQAGLLPDRQIELLKTFADQAAIAIENVRLFEAEQQRTRELSESLEQQTATSEVLKVISSSPGELQPVFEAMLANATHICEATFGNLLLREGPTLFRSVAVHSKQNYADSFRRNPVIDLRDNPGIPLDRIAHTKQVIHIADLRTDQSYIGKNNRVVTAVEAGGARTFLVVPMLKEGELIGAIAMYREEVRPFTDKQIELVKNFAAQAVIAIENTRLLNELRESLAQQTATSEVLQVISSSPGELEPVFSAMLEHAVRICDAGFGALWLYDGKAFRAGALYHVPRDFTEYWKRGPHSPSPESILARVVRTKQTIEMVDLKDEPGYAKGDPMVVTGVDVAGIRSFIMVPMLKEDEMIGAIGVYQQEILPFTEKQVALVTNFAAQAVIAIENTRLLNELRQRTDDLSEALEQQTATAEVLNVISSSPGDLQPVFDAILANATDLCGARFASLRLSEGDQFRTVSLYNAPTALVEHWRSTPLVRPHPESALGRAALTKQVAQIDDVTKGPAYRKRDPLVVAGADLGGYRTVLAVPMLKEDALIGVISIYHQEVHPFTGKEIELVKNFAAQAVIAIENTRLLNELRESLQQQTATADILATISSSQAQLKPVFETVVDRTTRICGATFACLGLFEGEALRFAAISGASADSEFFNPERLHQPDGCPYVIPLARAKNTVQTPDLRVERGYLERDPFYVIAADVGRARTVLRVPLLKDSVLLGHLWAFRQEVRPFTDKQIALLQNFAAQAVIAIENTRLLNELRESLQQQTATADVLKVISRSAFDLKVVLRTLVESAAQLCEAQQAIVTQSGNDGLYRLAASFGYPEEFEEYMRQNPLAPSRATTTGRVALEGKIVHIPDVLADPEYVFPKGQQLGGYRSNLGVPLLRDGVPIGAFVLTRPVVKPFTNKQIELVESFAAQAVIAIENARLLNELCESLQQQTATADVLRTISRSTFDLQIVLDTLLSSAIRLCGIERGMIFRYDGDSCHAVAAHNLPPEFLELWERTPVRAGRGTTVGRALLERRPVQIVDVQTDPEYAFDEARKMFGFRTTLAVPMLREGVPKGVIALTKTQVEPFTDKQIALVETFADQAAIAIENVRLFESVEARTRDLAKSLDDLRSTQDRLVQTQKLASLGQLTAGIAHEIKNPLNFVNNFSGVSVELIDELRQALAGANLDSKLRAEVSEIADTLQGNLDKVVQHGKRADAIVKNMLLHSREGSGEHRVVDINALVEESLNLAYHGARAEKQGFNITMERSLDPAAGQADVFPQDLTRVLLNLISNGFYAATKRRAEADGDGYEPTLVASTRNLGDRVEIRIRDNGMGISPEIKEKMFNPFFTTKPAGEGTGLGLSICHDIIVKQHGGTIEVDTQSGEFTEIRVTLPRVAASLS